MPFSFAAKSTDVSDLFRSRNEQLPAVGIGQRFWPLQQSENTPHKSNQPYRQHSAGGGMADNEMSGLATFSRTRWSM